MRTHGLFDHGLPLRMLRRQAQLDALLPRRHRLLQLLMPPLHATGIVGRCRRDQVAVRLAQCGHHRQVGRRHRIAAQLVLRHPGDRLAFAPARCALPAAHMAHFQGQVLVRIALRHIHQPGPDIGLDAQLFAQFTHQRLLGGLAGFTLAAGEFPQAGHVAVLGTAVEQHAATGVGDDGGHDVDRSGGGNHGGSMPRTGQPAQ